VAAVPLRVVLIDDDDGLAALLQENFEADGRFRLVGRGRNGREGLDVVRESAPDVVLMDLHMPVMGGVAATRALLEEDRNACVIAFTSSNDVREQEAARQAGARTVLAKPFDPVAFLDAVARHARNHAGRADAA
jgi:CheY-like chemotaxis protein